MTDRHHFQDFSLPFVKSFSEAVERIAGTGVENTIADIRAQVDHCPRGDHRGEDAHHE